MGTNRNHHSASAKANYALWVKPNIFHVWAYKTQEGVINTAEKVGTATEKGIQKIRPSAHQALDSAKTITNNTAEQAKETGQQVTQNVNKKLHETKQVITGQTDQPASIYQGSLSQPSSAPVDAPAVQAPSVSSPQPVAPQTVNEPNHYPSTIFLYTSPSRRRN